MTARLLLPLARLLLGLMLFCVCFSTLAQMLTAAQLLSRVEISGGPVPNPVSGAVAFITHDSSENDDLASFRPAGTVCVVAPGPGCVVASRGAHELAWSPDGRQLAFYQGFGRARDLVVAGSGDRLTVIMRLSVAGDQARKSAIFFPPVWLGDNNSLLVLEALDAGPGPTPEGPWSLISGAHINPLDNHFRDDTLRRILRVSVPGGETRALTVPLAIRDLVPSPDRRHILVVVEDQSAAGFFAGDSLVRPLRFLLLDPETAKLQTLPVSEGQRGEWADSQTLVIRSGSALLEYNMADAELDSLQALSPDHATRFTVSGRYIINAVESNSAGEMAGYIIPPPSPALLEVMDREHETLSALSPPDERQEVLQLESVPGSGKALVLTRDLQDFSEAVLLVEPVKGKTSVLFSGPVSISALTASASGNTASFLTETDSGNLEVFRIDLGRKTTERVFMLEFNPLAQPMVEPEVIRYRTPSGEGRQALLYLPRDVPAASAPLIVSAYGRQTNGRHVFQAMAQLHAARGYAYLMPDVFPERGNLKGSYVEQVPAAVSRVRELYGMRGPVGYFGGSLGGLAGLYLLSETDIIDAAVLRAAPSDFSMSWVTGKDRDADLLEYLMSGATPFDARDEYVDQSPIWGAERITAPALLLHGDQDAQVPLSQGTAMYQALRRLGKDTELRIYPSADHSIVRGNRAYYLDFHSQIFRWWESRLETRNVPAEVHP